MPQPPVPESMHQEYYYKEEVYYCDKDQDKDCSVSCCNESTKTTATTTSTSVSSTNTNVNNNFLNKRVCFAVEQDFDVVTQLIQAKEE